jgi:NOL1/NOP2/sun family putative RNA methylase
LEKWKLIYGENTVERFIEAFSIGKIQALRVNTLRIHSEELVERLIRKGFLLKKKLPKSGFHVLKEPFSLGITTEYLAGHYFLQGLSSQLVAEVLSPQPGQIVADVAAAPGGKTSHIAQLMENNGIIIAIERSKHRILPLKNNLQRCGVVNCIGLHGDARFMNHLPIQFDKILVDAPCTGTGTLHKNSSKLVTYKPEDSMLLSKIQLHILVSAFSTLVPGGEILYCTCSMEPEENEMVIQQFLTKMEERTRVKRIHLDLANTLKPLERFENEEFHSDIRNCIRIMPTECYEGFFIALLEKVEEK